MAVTFDSGGPTSLDPDQAFSALGHEVRVKILQRLGEADGILTYTELREQVGLSQGEHFNYHLDQLVGHFVAKTQDGYDLHPAGRRVVEAVLSGAITEAPVTERTSIDASCQLCSAPIEVRYYRDRVETYCTECRGIWGNDKHQSTDHIEGYLGRREIPPAGLKNRSAGELYRAAWIWQTLKFHAISNEICPACSATLDIDLTVCAEHGPADGRCEQCDRRYAALLQTACPNCIFEVNSTAAVAVAATNTDLLDLLTAKGLNPISPDSIAKVQHVYSDFEEKIISTAPFEGEFTFTVDGDQITFAVDDSMCITDVLRTD